MVTIRPPVHLLCTASLLHSLPCKLQPSVDAAMQARGSVPTPCYPFPCHLRGLRSAGREWDVTGTIQPAVTGP